MELANIPIRVIQKMGRWSAESKTFQRFYSKMDIQETEAFLERHLAEVDSGNSRVPLPGSGSSRSSLKRKTLSRRASHGVH